MFVDAILPLVVSTVQYVLYGQSCVAPHPEFEIERARAYSQFDFTGDGKITKSKKEQKAKNNTHQTSLMMNTTKFDRSILYIYS